jgi:hypothetical protein
MLRLASVRLGVNIFILALPMTEKRKHSMRTELPKQKKIDELRQKFVTARMGRTEKTNSFLNDPIAFHSQENNQEQEEG